MGEKPDKGMRALGMFLGVVLVAGATAIVALLVIALAKVVL